MDSKISNNQTISQVQQQSIFHDFYQKLKSQQAIPVRKAIESFVRIQLPKLIKSDSREDQGEKVQQLMTEMTLKFNEIFPPKNQGQGDENDEEQLNGEGIENCVMKNLYQDLFNHSSENEFNEKYVEQTLIHQRFLKPEHLDLPTGEKARIDPVRIEHAVQQLLSLNKYKTPKAKLTMLINFCRVISIMLQETSPDGQPDGADMFFPSCIYSFLQIEEKQILQDLNTNIQFVKHFRHQDRLTGEDEYYLTTLESVVEFIHGIQHSDLKIDKIEYEKLVQKSINDIDQEKKAKEEAAKYELADLLDMNSSSKVNGQSNAVESGSFKENNDLLEDSQINDEAKNSKKKKEKCQLGNLDKVYGEMKQKNKKLKKEVEEQKKEMKNLRSVFAEFQIQFRHNKKHDKTFEQLTVSDLQDLFAIQQKLMAQIEQLEINSNDLQNSNWAEFDIQDHQQEDKPYQVPTTQIQREAIRLRAERAESSRSRSRARQNKNH